MAEATQNKKDELLLENVAESGRHEKLLAAGGSGAAEPAPVPALSPVPAMPAQPWYRRRKLWLYAGLVLLALAGAATYLLARADPAPGTHSAAGKPAAGGTKAMGAVAIIVDGTVETSADMTDWIPLVKGQAVKAGHYLRSASNGRAVLELDDGSAVRLGNTTTVRLTSLKADDVQIANLSGEVYSRVVPSERNFTVTVEDERYQALGTAYKTVHTAQSKGVEVYHSQVKAARAGQTVSEGKRFYQANSQAGLSRKVSDIPLDQLQKDAFLQWNLEQDQQSSEFKDKLGYLAKLAAQPKPVVPQPQPSPAAAAGIVLGGSKYDSGISLSWKVSGVSVPQGFKIVKSLSPNPTYGKDEAAYVADGAARHYSWKIKDGKTYHFRICVLNGDGCIAYSNNFTATAPLVASPQPSGSLTLTSLGGKNVSWLLNGSAPNGYKLVWSAAAEPTYPGASAKYYEAGATAGSIDAGSGSYYVRICMYKEGGCVNYSNQLYVTVP